MRLFLTCTLIRLLINWSTPVLQPAYRVYFRPFGTGTDSLYFGIAGVCLLLWIVRCEAARRLRYSIFVAALLIGVVLTTSRSGLLSFLVGLFVLLMELRLSGKLKVVVAVAMTGLIIIFSIPATYLEVVGDRYSGALELSSDANVIYRLDSWSHGMAMLRRNPLLGDGFGSYSARQVSGFWEKADVHNAYLEIASRMGILGLLLFLAMLSGGVWRSWKAMQQSQDFAAEALLISLTMVLVFIFFNAELREARSGYFLWLALAASTQLNREKRV